MRQEKDVNGRKADKAKVKVIENKKLFKKGKSPCRKCSIRVR